MAPGKSGLHECSRGSVSLPSRPSNRLGMQPWALSLPDKELCLREALAVCTPPLLATSVSRPRGPPAPPPSQVHVALKHPSAPAPSIQYHASNLDWRFVSYMILYMFQCHFPTKSLQSCPTLCDPRDGSPPGSPVPGILEARTLEWVVQVNSEGTQPHIHMYPSSPKLPSHPCCHTTLSRVPCAIHYLETPSRARAQTTSTPLYAGGQLQGSPVWQALAGPHYTS